MSTNELIVLYLAFSYFCFIWCAICFWSECATKRAARVFLATPLAPVLLPIAILVGIVYGSIKVWRAAELGGKKYLNLTKEKKMNTPKPCNTCYHCWYNCMTKDYPHDSAYCVLDREMGNLECPKYKSWERKGC